MARPLSSLSCALLPSESMTGTLGSVPDFLSCASVSTTHLPILCFRSKSSDQVFLGASHLCRQPRQTPECCPLSPPYTVFKSPVGRWGLWKSKFTRLQQRSKEAGGKQRSRGWYKGQDAVMPNGDVITVQRQRGLSLQG